MRNHDCAKALASLESARFHLDRARRDAGVAANLLGGSRQRTVGELVEEIADDQTFADRLCMVVEGDVRAEARWDPQVRHL